MNAAEKRAAMASMIEQAKAAGFRVSPVMGLPGPAMTLYSWTRVVDDRIVDRGASDWKTKAEAWGDAIVAHASELMEP